MKIPAPNPNPGADLSRLLAPPVLAWLAERGCGQATWRTAADLPTSADLAMPSLDFDFDIGPAPGHRVGLRLVFGTAIALTEADKAAVSAYLAALGPFLSGSAPGEAERVVTLPRELLLAVEHQLRNHLNSLLMNAAVVSLRCGDPGGMDPYLDQMECDGQNCLELLRWISDRVA